MVNFLFTQTPLKFLVENLWRDEAFSIILAQKNIFEIIKITAQDFSPPLYFFLLHIWTSIFGASEITIRSLSFIFYWATIYVVYLFLTHVFKIENKRSLPYLLFFILNPTLLFYAFETRMYTMFAFLATLSFYAFYTKNQLLHRISSILGLFTHYFMVFALFTQIVYLLWEKKFLFKELWHNKKSPRKNLNEFITIIRPFILPLSIFTIWMLFVFTQKRIVGESFWIESMRIRDIIYIPGMLYTGYENGLHFLTSKTFGYSTLLLHIFIIFASFMFFIYRTVKKHENKEHYNLFLYIFLWALLTPTAIFLLSFVKPLFLPRYLIFATVGLLFLIVFIAEHLKPLPRIIFIFLVFMITLNYHQLLGKHYSKHQPAATIKEIKAIAGENDLLYVTSELDYHIGQYYFDKDKTFVYTKEYGQIPSYVGKALIPESALRNSLPAYPQRAFILRGNTYEIQSMY